MWNIFQVKDQDPSQWSCSGVFIINFKYISFLFCLLLVKKINTPALFQEIHLNFWPVLFRVFQFKNRQMKWYGKKCFQKICSPLDVKKQAFFQIFFYNRYTVVKTQSRVELWSSISSWIFFLFCFWKTLERFSILFTYFS